MIIKLNLSAKTYKADLGEKYGIFTITPMGAGAELELSQLATEMKALSKDLTEIDPKKKPEDYTEAERKTIVSSVEKAQKNKIRTIEILKSCFESETEGAVDKLFFELDIATIRGAYDEVVANG